jgi:hypothetical protein
MGLLLGTVSALTLGVGAYRERDIIAVVDTTGFTG